MAPVDFIFDSSDFYLLKILIYFIIYLIIVCLLWSIGLMTIIGCQLMDKERREAKARRKARNMIKPWSVSQGGSACICRE